ncbi:hypothetical protein Pcinc_017106 [Petrolisthes cinctipes]|uniref:Uncharacterized protein n=1 Tax=Petrolisthes cinctipes TaxID=88211 RepID=A0AAE1FPY6_PETCI|nr:hypothetical protein Pcinc_017106 [Petrolisthes cinctipes]
MIKGDEGGRASLPATFQCELLVATDTAFQLFTFCQHTLAPSSHAHIRNETQQEEGSDGDAASQQGDNEDPCPCNGVAFAAILFACFIAEHNLPFSPNNEENVS